MKALLYKDFIAIKKALLLTLVILAVIAFYFYKEDQIYLLPLFFILLPVIILGMLFGADSQDQLDHYLVPSPVKRSTIVLSRYVIVWFMSTLAVILALMMPWLTKGNNPLALDWILLVPGIFLMTSFISAVQLPLMYRFGEAKARLIFVGLYFVTFAFFASIASNKEWLVAKLQAGFNLDSRYLALILAAASILVNGISYLCSRMIYEKREF